MKTKETSTREQAMQWWNQLISDFGKYTLCSRYYPKRDFSSLTGREIEEIWLKETGGELATGGENLWSL